jgi:hypothetical protein
MLNIGIIYGMIIDEQFIDMNEKFGRMCYYPLRREAR